MSDIIKRDTVFVALTRPQMLAGVTYNFFMMNGLIATELFIISKSFWVLGTALIIHFLGVLLCLHEPRFFDLWITRASRCPRVRNYALWGCNSYRP